MRLSPSVSSFAAALRVPLGLSPAASALPEARAALVARNKATNEALTELDRRCERCGANAVTEAEVVAWLGFMLAPKGGGAIDRRFVGCGLHQCCSRYPSQRAKSFQGDDNS
jgi:hypothetical protein